MNVEEMITEMKQLLAEAAARKAAWPPVFIESSMCPEGQIILMDYTLFEDGTWRIMFNPTDRPQVRHILRDFPNPRVRKASKKDAFRYPKPRIIFEGEFTRV